jgi:yecA family protein
MDAKKGRKLCSNDYIRIDNLLRQSSQYSAESLAEAHGLLTAIGSAPELIPTDKWYGMLLDNRSTYYSKKEAVENLKLFISLYEEVSVNLADEQPFIILLWEHGAIQPIPWSSPHVLSSWCKGYINGVKMDNTWTKNEEALSLMLPIAVLANEFDLIGLKDEKGNIIHNETYYKQDFKSELEETVKNIYSYWQDNRNEKTTRSLEKKTKDIVSNRFCFCNSGKKIKDCCWNNVIQLH